MKTTTGLADGKYTRRIRSRAPSQIQRSRRIVRKDSIDRSVRRAMKIMSPSPRRKTSGRRSRRPPTTPKKKSNKKNHKRSKKVKSPAKRLSMRNKHRDDSHEDY